jgi:hypothetical protein
MADLPAKDDVTPVTQTEVVSADEKHRDRLVSDLNGETEMSIRANNEFLR